MSCNVTYQDVVTPEQNKCRIPMRREKWSRPCRSEADRSRSLSTRHALNICSNSQLLPDLYDRSHGRKALMNELISPKHHPARPPHWFCTRRYHYRRQGLLQPRALAGSRRHGGGQCGGRSPHARGAHALAWSFIFACTTGQAVQSKGTYGGKSRELSGVDTGWRGAQKRGREGRETSVRGGKGAREHIVGAHGQSPHYELKNTHV